MAFKQDISDVCASVDGKVISKPELVTRFGNERIFEVLIEYKRISGTVDTFKINYSSKLGVVLKEGLFIHIDGDIRTVNSPKDQSKILGCIIYSKIITILDEEPEIYENDVVINNATLYEFNEIRKSFSNEDTDVANYRISVHRGHGRYSYFKTSSFNEDAIFLGNVHENIKSLNLKCRLCSSKSTGKSDRFYFYLAVYCLDVQFKDKEK